MRKTEKEIRYSPRELDKHFKGKEEPEIEEVEEECEIKEKMKRESKNFEKTKKREKDYNESRKVYNNNYQTEYRKEFREENNEYHRDWMRYSREKKKNPGMNISFKEWRKNNRKDPKNSEIKNIENLVTDIKKYSVDFPEKEFNKKLDEIIKYNPTEIKEKTLKDILYDIFDKKGILSMERLLSLYNGSNWGNAIKEFMITKNYLKNGEDNYIPSIQQNEQK